MTVDPKNKQANNNSNNNNNNNKTQDRKANEDTTRDYELGALECPKQEMYLFESLN